MNVTKRNIGVNFSDKGASVKLWAPLAKTVSIHFDDKSLTLEKTKYGYWEKEIDLAPGTRYRFSVNGEAPLPDPASLLQPEGVHGDSEAFDLRQLHRYDDKNWKHPALKDYIIYELHTGTFSEQETFEGIIEKLPHLVALGITAIEVMPVAQFPGSRNWGYDGVFPFAVQNSYGGPAGLRKLVAACHQAGIAVILDVVYNHLGPEGNYLGAYGPYFTDKYQTPWGPAINFDDAWCDGVRDYFTENALMWFRDFNIDALRLDAVHAIKDFSARHILRQIKEATMALSNHNGRSYHLIAESDLNDPRFIDPVENNGFGMDAQWIDEFHHALRVSVGEQPSGYYSDFNGPAHLAKSYRDAYVYDGQFSPHRKKFFGKPATAHEGSSFIVFAQNHDQVGNRALGERSSMLYPAHVQRLMAAAYILGPYIPMLFMGEEWGETNPFLYFVSHGDPDLCQAVREGRRKEFAYFFDDTAEVPDPVDEKTFAKSKLQWDFTSQEEKAAMMNYYKELIRLRKTIPALAACSRSDMSVSYLEAQQCIQATWKEAGKKISLVMNFSDQQQNISLQGNFTILLHTNDHRWGGRFKPEENNIIREACLGAFSAMLVQEQNN